MGPGRPRNSSPPGRTGPGGGGFTVAAGGTSRPMRLVDGALRAQRPRVLIVAGGAAWGGVAEVMAAHRWRVESLDDARRLVERVLNTGYDAVVVGADLPPVEGVGACERLRRAGYVEPIVVVTAAGAAPPPADELAGDACLAAPFGAAAIETTLAALLRRRATGEGASLGDRIGGRLGIGPLARGRGAVGADDRQPDAERGAAA